MKRLAIILALPLLLIGVALWRLQPLAVQSSASAVNWPSLELSSDAPVAPVAQVSQPTMPSSAERAQVVETYGKLPLRFEVNAGQTDSQVKFLSRGSGYQLFLTANEAVLALRKDEGRGMKDEKSILDSSFRLHPSAFALLRLQLVGANPQPQMSGLEMLPDKSNYFIGSDSQKWRTDVANFARVKYADVYPGVNLVYYGNQQQLEYDFVVSPSMSSDAIVLSVQGAEWIEHEPQGDLLLHTAGGVVRQRKPSVYQDVDGARRLIEGDYVLRDLQHIGFRVGAYDASRALIIDPVLIYSTFLGGSGLDAANGVVVDSAGQAIIVGKTDSSDFPLSTSPYDNSCGCTPGLNSDVFLTKLNAAGSGLIFSTYFGGSADDQGYAIAQDSSGDLYMTGRTTSTDIPTTTGVLQPTNRGGSDAFVTKFKSTGNQLLYSTYLGGSTADEGYAIAVDSAKNAHVAGKTDSGDFTTTANAYQPNVRGFFDAFVAKVNITGSALLYSTYLGGTGSGFEQANGLAVDSSGKIYVVGQTPSTDFPNKNALQPSLLGSSDGWLAKIDPSQTPGSATLLSATFLGGSAVENANAVGLDASGNIYVVGKTSSPNFYTTTGVLQLSLNGIGDAFVTKLNNAASSVLYSTYLGGGGSEEIFALKVEPATGFVIVAGKTDSDNFPLVNPFQAVKASPVGGGNDDAFVAKLNPSGSVLYLSSYLGGNASDEAHAIALDNVNSIYVVGQSDSANFPLGGTPFQMKAGGSTDGFVAKIADPGTVQGAGNALHFDGIDDRVVISPTNLDLNVGVGPHTLEAWARWTANGGNARGILSIGSFNDKLTLTTGNGSTGQDKIAYGHNPTWYYDAGAGLNDGRWHHVAAISSTVGITLYVDGVERPYSIGSIGVGNSNEIGHAPNYDYFGGQIDEVRVWNVARTQDQILSTMNRRLNGTEPGLMGYWRFDEGSGYFTNDFSGHDSKGTLVGSPVWISATTPLTSTPTKHLTGRVVNLGASSIVAARVIASRTDGNGLVTALVSGTSPYTYFMDLDPGMWAVNVMPQEVSPLPPNWIYSNAPAFVSFNNDTVDVVQTLNLTLTAATATFQGQLLLPSGAVGSFAPNSLHLSVHNAEGVGNETSADTSGYFALRLPAGSYLVTVNSTDPLYYLDPFTINLTSTQTLVKSVKLQARDAQIYGRVLNTVGLPVSGIEVVATQRDGLGLVRATSSITGGFNLPVYAGMWDVTPRPNSALNYVPATASTRVKVKSGVSVLQDLQVALASGTIDGRVVLSGTNAVYTTANGFMSASSSTYPDAGAPIVNGLFSLNVVPNTPYGLAPIFPPGSGFGALPLAPLTLNSLETRIVTLTVVADNATIIGFLNRLGTSQPLTGTEALVVGVGVTGNERAARVDTQAGAYALTAKPGHWTLGATLGRNANYVVRPRAQSFVDLTAGQTTRFDFDVQPLDGAISGQVLISSTPAVGAFVRVDELFAPTTGPRLRLGATTDANGNFSLRVPNGQYVVSAGLGEDPSVIEPQARTLTVGPGATVSTTLIFRTADAVIVGTVMLPSGPITHSAWLWASSTGGGKQTAYSDASGAFTLPVHSGQVWQLGADYEESGVHYYSGPANVSVPSASTVSRNLQLIYSDTLPTAVVVSFDASTAQVINLRDGTQVQIPAGALATSGIVTVRIMPRSDVPHDEGRQLIGLEYNLEAFDSSGQSITKFNEYVSIILHYTDAQLSAVGADESDLVPSYLDLVSGSWKPLDNVILDTANNTVTLLTDHFTCFGDMGALTQKTYLPVVVR